MLTSYHNHTRWSDGAASLAEFLDAARKRGIDELGVSDHYTLHRTGIAVSWSMPLENLEHYVEESRHSAAKSLDVVLRVGLEADFFPETVVELDKRLSRLPFDFVIASVHFIDDFQFDADAKSWKQFSADGIDELWRAYWHRVCLLAEHGCCDIVAHLDLPKKFGYRPTVDLSAESDAALDAIARSGMAIEINTNGWNFPAKEAYPSLELLNAARQRDIPLMINADAHTPGRLLDHFDAARALAAQAGYHEVVRFERRVATRVPL